MGSIDARASKVPADAPYYNLGNYSRPISTKSRDAQVWFDRGLTWSYGFSHTESAVCFEKAIAHDPECAILHWGLAYALGPNYNKNWEAFDPVELNFTIERTTAAAKRALELESQASPSERALIRAIQHRYPQDHSPDDSKDCLKWNQAYASAMEPVYEEFGEDLDVAALYADSLMVLTPWALWDIKTGGVGKGAHSLTVKKILEKALQNKQSKFHPGILHFYIHLMEMSSTPELGLKPADHLRGLCPDAGHLEHMPSHLDVLIGDYRRAIASNADAIRVDEIYQSQTSDSDFYTFYRLHNYNSLIYAAMFAGQEHIAMEMVGRMEASAPEKLLRVESPSWADVAETTLSVRFHVLIRFGRWQEIKDTPLPKDQKLYCVTTAHLHYAKGVAYAATGDVEQAEAQRVQFEEAFARVPDSRIDFPNNCRDELAIAREMLNGELEYRRGNVDAAFAHLQKSVKLDDSLIYSEPWGWMQPTRHAYAALLMEQGRVDEASDMYRADLGLDDTLPRARQHPDNVWALHGYHECLVKLERKAEADMVRKSLRLALAVADVQVESSCYCRNVKSQKKVGNETAADCCPGPVAS